jgi:alcohol dehydrogenase
MLRTMERFSIEMPRAVHFGAGALDQLAPSLGSARRVLLVSGSRWLSGSPWRQAVERGLGGCEAVRSLCCPAGEPTTLGVAAALEEALAFGPDAMVAVGGGSVLDTARALSALLVHGGPVERFLEGMPGCVEVPGQCLPWVAVPTTAGTGAEVTKNAVIRVVEKGVKRSMRSAHLLAAAVIADPRLTLSLPLEVTGICGLDALVQLVEAFVSRKSTAFVRGIVRQAFPGMLAALRGLPRALDSLELRAAASWGALVSGIALANGGLGAAHGFAAALGGKYGIPHGLLCAIFLPPVLEANAAVIRDSLADLADAAGAGSVDPVAWLSAEVRTLCAAYELPPDLRGRAVPRGAVEELVALSQGSSMKGNPRELAVEEMRAIVSSLL